ncbi:MAG: hypothetical protein ACOC32_01255 [Nanoarchaeota archaeon]
MERNGIIGTLSVLLIILILSAPALAVSISPSELRIKNIEPEKEYKFIVLVANDEQGLVDVELRTSESALAISPKEFMLGMDEKKSIRIAFNAKHVDEEKKRIIVQPYVNDIPSESKLTILLEDGNATVTPDIEESAIQTIIREPEFITIIIYVMLIVVALLVIIIFIPEIKKNIKTTKTKTLKLKDKQFYKHALKKTGNLEKRLADADKKILKIISDVEAFHSKTDAWLKHNSGGRYGLE